jgi:hypothetical protein
MTAVNGTFYDGGYYNGERHGIGETRYCDGEI